MFEGIQVLRGSVPRDLGEGEVLAIYVIGSTKTSLIPNISIAGSMPIATLFTPALDVEYLYYGKPTTLDVIPTTPTGIPTPALITRTALSMLGIPYLVVDTGSYIEPKIPRVVLPSKSVGGRIDIEPALPPGTSRKLFEEGLGLGRNLGSLVRTLLIGESIPAGTTTAMSILCALGFRCFELVSSSMKNNPVDLKKSVVEKAVKRVKKDLDFFEVNDAVGDPLHVSVAGIALGALDTGSYVILAGGTQMLAVLAFMKVLRPNFKQKIVIHATTKWVVRDKCKEIIDFIDSVAPEITSVYTDLDFSKAPYEGLRAYEEGYVKEGVGAGGTAFLALIRGTPYEALVNAIYSEYGRLVGGPHA